jgi:arylsulfatase A-like enzyme
MKSRAKTIWASAAAIVLLMACQAETNADNESPATQPPTADLVVPATQSSSYDEPNVVIIVADDLGWADVGYHGSDIETPNLDQMAKDGMRLERFYSMPICTPTRSALMTARDPMKLGTAYAGFQPWNNGGVSPEEHFMPESFKAAGYQTAMIGKWHLGHTIQPMVPNSRGFDHFYGHLNTQIDHFKHSVAGGHDLQENGTSVQREGEYSTVLHANETVRYLEEIRDPGKPFFLYMPLLAPHAPMQAPEDLMDKYPKRRDLPTKRKTYAAMVDAMDQAIGDVLNALDAQGVADNTIVLFFSDNGGLEAFGADNGPYRGGKLETFEGGIRVASLIKWPDNIPAGSVNDAAISVLDVFPSLAAATGVKMGHKKKVDGQDRWNAIQGKETGGREGPLFFASGSPIYNKYHVSMIDGDWKLVQIIDHKNASTEVENFLFEINKDPGEENNLAVSYPGNVAKMAKAINEWRSQHPIGGVQVGLAPHPGWRPPLDYAQSVIPSSELQVEGFDTYVKGMRAKILQKRHEDRGKITYE